MKLNTTIILAAASLSMGSAQAATLVWNNGNTNLLFNQQGNWDIDGTPGTGTTALATFDSNLYTISNGDTVNGSSVNMNIGKSGSPASLTISGGSELNIGTTHWTQIRNGSTMTVDGGTYNRTSGNRLQVHTTSFLVATNGATIQGQASLFDVITSSTVTIDGGSSFDFLDYSFDATALINFTGAGTMKGETASTWEALYTAGTLKFGNSNVAAFADNFSTSGTFGDASYTLTAVPEPSSTALLGLGGFALIFRRRK